MRNLKAPDHMEGKNLVSSLHNPAKEPDGKAYAYTIWLHNRWSYDETIMGYSVTDDQFYNVECIQLETGELLERELYDHAKDPDEMESVVENQEYAEVVAELPLKAKLRKEETDHDHPFKNLR